MDWYRKEWSCAYWYNWSVSTYKFRWILHQSKASRCSFTKRWEHIKWWNATFFLGITLLHVKICCVCRYFNCWVEVSYFFYLSLIVLFLAKSIFFNIITFQIFFDLRYFRTYCCAWYKTLLYDSLPEIFNHYTFKIVHI